MQDFISHKNIEHYRSLLASDRLDDAQRAEVEKLLAKELANEPPPEPPGDPINPALQK